MPDPTTFVTTLDVLEMVHGFYRNSWTDLLWVVGVLGAFVGVLIPIATQWYQRSTLKEVKSDLLADFERKTQSMQQELENALSIIGDQERRSRDTLEQLAESLTASTTEKIEAVNKQMIDMHGDWMGTTLAMQSSLLFSDYERTKKAIHFHRAVFNVTLSSVWFLRVRNIDRFEIEFIRLSEWITKSACYEDLLAIDQMFINFRHKGYVGFWDQALETLPQLPASVMAKVISIQTTFTQRMMNEKPTPSSELKPPSIGDDETE